ncbi:M1 family metallopeptidase [Winogradskyella luteola]|uniref:M1 family metallopeptidase n=1 Tax=Winogradskyella luteola TaxID=2828330 RepID=A0A9X1F585_9FLAO|nr:M1 family metallopeptidase [Winogradskyella luteola]MBV7267630.1 M1 family metallopeptidase [Winogradskyella luteola]
MKKLLSVSVFFLLSVSFAQQTDYVDFKQLNADLFFIPDSTNVKGVLNFEFDIIKDIDSVYIDARQMKFFDLTLIKNNTDAKSVPMVLKNDEKRLIIYSDFKKNETYHLSFKYTATPKKALYFVERNGNLQIWTQGQGKYTSNWLPSIDDVNDKIQFDLKITHNKKYEVISNGLLEKKHVNDSTTTWNYNMQMPMPSYLVALAIGEYDKKIETSKSGIPLEYYYYPEDSLKVEPTYRYSKQMFDFLEEEIGFAYPWQNYKQVPVHDFLYAGMENTSCTIFSDAFVVDSIGFNDKNYINVNAHELAHQWFGNLVTAKSGKHHWLQEGFATYYALLAERDIFDDNHYFFKLYESAVDLGRQDIAGKGTSLLNPKSSSLTFYQRGAWVIHALRNKVGDAIFKQAVRNYLNKHQFANVETSDFISEVESLYGKSLYGFVNLWIKQKEFPVDAAFNLLKNHSTYINEYLMVDCQTKSSKCTEYLKYYVSDEAKVKVISQAPDLVTKDTFKHGLKVRQAISQYVTKIPKNLKEEYESLLNDKSYMTIENALYNLWSNFPEERAKYLSKTRNVVGLSDKNVRLLWIVLNLSTPFYQADNKQGLFEELVSYTDEKYNADLRISAFQYLDLIKSCNEKCISNIENAKSHHNWRLVKFAKEFSEKLQNKE